MGGAGAVLLVLGIGGWANTTEISSAVIAQGHLAARSNVKPVEHPTGGVVVELGVAEGDLVKAGQVVARLDDVTIRASLEIVNQSIGQLQAKEIRLLAELNNESEIIVPASLAAAPDGPSSELLSAEKKLFELRRAALAGEQAQLEQRVSQVHQEIDGIKLQISAKQRERELVSRDLEAVRSLLEKKLVSSDRVSDADRQLAQLDGQIGQLQAAAAQGAGRVTETQLQILQSDYTFQADVAEELAQVQAKLAELKERRVAGEGDLAKTIIRAPQAGQVHELTIRAAGGVLGPGDALMRLVPTLDALRADVRIAPQDIDQVHVGETALVRFSALNLRTTPEIYGSVERVSADVTTDNSTGATYFTVQIAFETTELNRLDSTRLTIGMPVEAFIINESRTALSYLAKPLSDQITRSFRGE
jgi:HlyD family secretion protein